MKIQITLWLRLNSIDVEEGYVKSNTGCFIAKPQTVVVSMENNITEF